MIDYSLTRIFHNFIIETGFNNKYSHMEESTMMVLRHID